MKFGYLTFSYSNFATFAEQMRNQGHYSINLGDFMQTLAVRALYLRFRIPDDQTVAVDRDTLPNYDGEPIILPMNACFSDWTFPLPATVKPVFIGFQTTKRVAEQHIDFFRVHQPIGCRDLATAQMFRSLGVAAHVTGCLTLTFEQRTETPSQPCTYVIYGKNTGAFPSQALKYAPSDFWDNVEFVNQRKVVHVFPLGVKEIVDAESHAKSLLSEYRARATLAVSPLHHAVTPCLSSGIPVILCRKKNDSRFSFLRDLTKLYLPQHFTEIRWTPDLDKIDEVRARLVALFEASVLSHR